MFELLKSKKLQMLNIVLILLLGSTISSQSIVHQSKASTSEKPDTLLAGSTETIGIEIVGETGSVTEPRIICTPENRIFIIWKEEYSSFNDTYGVYDLNDTVYVQELFIDGSLKGERKILYKETDFMDGVIATKDVSLIVDSENNFHFLWYLMYTNGSSVGNQYDYIFYKKLDNDLATIIDLKSVFSSPILSGYGSSPFSSSYIDDLVIDEYSHIHFLFDSKYYFYLDINGFILDYFDMFNAGLGSETNGISDSLVIDGLNNSYIASIDSYDYIYLTKLSTVNSNISYTFTNEIFYNDTDFLLSSRIHKLHDKLYISWNQEFVQYHYYEFNSSGQLIQEVDLALRKGKLSNNGSLVYAFKLIGRPTAMEDKEFQYTLYDVNNSQIFDAGPILIIARNSSNTYGPEVFNFNCIEDLNENLWLIWCVRDGVGGKQIMFWKISVIGESLRPVTSIAPVFHVYEFVVVPEFPFKKNVVWIAALCILLSITIISGTKKKNLFDN